MAVNFPSNPILNDTYSSGGRTWRFDGIGWVLVAAASGPAPSLETPRLLWGQSFDGTADVSGALTGVGNITGSGAITLTSGGSNQNVNINTSGTGSIILDTGTSGGTVQLRGGTSGTRIYNAANTYYNSINVETLTGNRTLNLANSTTTLVGGTMVPTTVTITAGNGLSGGGDLSASRTLTLGTPGTLTDTTTNSVTSTSHTHDLDINAILTQPSAAVGTYRLCKNVSGSSMSSGTAYAGSGLNAAFGNSGNSWTSSTTTQPGTWTNMGNVTIGDNSYGLFMRTG